MSKCQVHNSSHPALLWLLVFAVTCCQPEASGDKDIDAWMENSRINQSVLVWLQCEECADGELQALLELGDAAVPALSAVLNATLEAEKKPRFTMSDPFQLYWLAEKERYRYLKKAEKDPEFAERKSEQEYVLRSVRTTLRRFRVRCTVALQSIGSPSAIEELKRLETEP